LGKLWCGTAVQLPFQSIAVPNAVALRWVHNIHFLRQELADSFMGAKENGQLII